MKLASFPGLHRFVHNNIYTGADLPIPCIIVNANGRSKRGTGTAAWCSLVPRPNFFHARPADRSSKNRVDKAAGRARKIWCLGTRLGMQSEARCPIKHLHGVREKTDSIACIFPGIVMINL